MSIGTTGGARSLHDFPRSSGPPWRSEGGSTKLSVVTVTGDVSLTALLQGDVELSNVVLASPQLTLETKPDGSVSPLTSRAGRAQAAAIDSFEIQDGSLRYV